MMDLLTSAMDAGAALAETFSKQVNTGASFTRYGTVVKNNGTTLDVELCGATLAAVPMLTTCAGAKSGDRCLLTVDGPLVTVTGILANADNTHYVNVKAVYYRNIVIRTDGNARWLWCSENQFVDSFGVNSDKTLVVVSNGDAAAAEFTATPSFANGQVYIDTTKANATIRIRIYIITFNGL